MVRYFEAGQKLINHDIILIYPLFAIVYKALYVYHYTYLSNKWGEILMLKNDGQDLFGEARLIHNIEGTTWVRPPNIILILFTLYPPLLLILILHWEQRWGSRAILGAPWLIIGCWHFYFCGRSDLYLTSTLNGFAETAQSSLFSLSDFYSYLEYALPFLFYYRLY
jgi:hypothetical protein